MKLSKLDSLQAGRALAAVAVLGFHLSLMMGQARYGGDAVFIEHTNHGYLGVDFFFVLSGFIILFAHGREIGHAGAWRHYAHRRLLRLYPVYWLYTISFMGLLALGLGTEAALPASAIDLATSLTLIRFSAATPALPVAWTLFHEVAFYTAFGVLLFNLRAGIALLAVWALMCLAWFHHATDSGATALDAYTAASNLYFLLGMGAYYLYRRGGGGTAETLGGLCLIAAALAALPLEYDLARFALVCGFALLLSGVTQLELQGHLRLPRWLVYVGDASYSLYLLHESIAGVLLKILVKLRLAAVLGGEAAYLVVLAATVALGCLAYSLIEKPLLAALRGGRARRPAPARI